MDVTLFKKISSFFKKENRVLGIDIGTSSIKIVQLIKEKERAVLETYGELATGPYAKLGVGHAVKLQEDVLASAIKDLLKEANITAKKAVVSIPLSSCFVTTINLPFNSESGLEEIIQLEARRYIPVPISEVVLDWWVLPQETAKNEQQKKSVIQVLLVAIHKDVIDSYKKIISESGLEAVAYEIESFSAIRSSLGRENTATALLDFGALTTKLSIVDYGVMKSSYSINHGSQELTTAISQSLGIDFSRAEEMKREIGLSDLPEHRDVNAIFEPVLNYIFSEVNRFIKDYQNKNNRSVGKVVMAGGGSSLMGLIDFSIKSFTIEVVLADPFIKVDYPVILSEVLKKVGVNFSVALGLALRNL
ncbi:MAG: type IV pilus assembly protein PilM [Parcubacteria group bacterium Athens0714_24]|nr:MAG: type IV pilus assembly protein PilM [Parcubacteria group bacterium Athens0714_24]